ncbi:DUF2784 domain-containing protein [Mycobacterium kansasii]|uniref:DUF2784 domain-containing protein n=2 Tax=Mycobacterium kansasii TaxID=1768 RepID=A0A653F7Q2_MYCKA|nr:DUF2784 domain-containing protein [Mycobacterium kansasii]EUA11822.1 hypothetical protein I545_5275 [Mycobacterium kansasii 662]KEP44052.1 hypothetical protein MKSMC1_08080 [Mycobacterium kansasii]UCA17811.1 DUF2784 domain-containing protein [Mycobacterium kansasii]UGT82670.1 DUF2784 domain-containing protein [Mycobacterium kansasii]UGT86948.1 DUF2784 domain-containing protein [Mycobacterium kansasii]
MTADMYIAVVVVVVAAHFAYIAYLVVGGFVALRWRRTIACHAFAVAWSVVSFTGHLNCPLTGLERWGRAHAGMAPLPPDGFIAHYITGVVYPSGWSAPASIAVFALVAVSWILVFGWQARRGTADANSERQAHGPSEITG